MQSTATPPAIGPTEIFRSLGDPVRWDIICQMAQVDELACSTLEDTLHVSKPTISYHTKILAQAGLISARKEGRHFFYTLRRDVLRALMDEVWALAPAPTPVNDGRIDFKSAPRRRKTRPEIRHDGAQPEVILLTW